MLCQLFDTLTVQLKHVCNVHQATTHLPKPSVKIFNFYAAEYLFINVNHIELKRNLSNTHESKSS